MEAYRTEEEQLEALRNWWKENGRSTIISIVVAVAAVFGWQSWQDQQQNKAQNGSLLYQNLLEANQSSNGVLSAEKLATARHLAGQLKESHASSLYGQFAALFLARYAVLEGDYATAEQELQWVLDAKPGADLEELATLRLARVVAAAGDTERATSLLQSKSVSFAPLYEEVKGDIYLSQGDKQAAAIAYRKALELGQQGETPLNSRVLEIKAQSLGVTQQNSAPIVEPEEG